MLARIPKVKCSESARLQQYVKEFKSIFSYHGHILYCQLCGKSMKIIDCKLCNICSSTNMLQHLHVLLRNKCFKAKQDTPSSHSGPTKCREIYYDLYRAFISADIPLHKVNSPELRNFLVKYMNLDPPDESTFRKHYLPNSCEETLKISELCVRKYG